MGLWGYAGSTKTSLEFERVCACVCVSKDIYIYIYTQMFLHIHLFFPDATPLPQTALKGGLGFRDAEP